ncbi:tetratricopeptide repeat protein [Castellaniella sp.]|uniref:tetratricopeptide repeat protein n=1 Tax=Castellaniella sp. TaxID=1955812 RepID=UPI003C735E6A
MTFQAIFFHRIAGRAGLLASVCLMLSACSAFQPNTAMELIQHQQEQESMRRTAESRAAHKNMPSQADMMLNVVREARADRRYYAVLAYSRQAIARHGHTPELDVLYAEALMETGQLEESRALYQTLTRTDLAAQAHHGLGLLAARSGQDARAVGELSAAVALQPANPVFLGDLGFAQLRAGDLGGAGLSIGQAAELAPNDQRILGNMAILLLLRNQPADAEALMRKAGFGSATRDRVHAMAVGLRAGAVPGPTAAGSASAGQSAALVTAEPIDETVRTGPAAPPLASLEHPRLVR